MTDLISRQAAKEHFYMYVPGLAWDKIDEILDDVPSAQPEFARDINVPSTETAERTAKTSQNVSNDDLISRKAAIDAISCDITVTGRQNAELVAATIGTFADRIKALPSVQPERKYTLEEVAEILSSVIGDECACNINGIDEWLPESCKYTEIGEECPNPKEKHGCWMQFLLQGGGADMRGEQE